jgi:hypothetical protein
MYLVSSGITGIPVCEAATHTLSWRNPNGYNNNTIIPPSLARTIETRIYYSYDSHAWFLFAAVGNGEESWVGALPPGEGVRAYYAVSATIPSEGQEGPMSEPVAFPVQGASPGDAVTVTLDDCTDTYVNSGPYAINTYSRDSLIRTYTWPAQTVANRGFMKWNLSPLPSNITVADAKLSLYYADEEGGGGDSSYTVSVAKMLGVNPVIEMCNWDTFDGIAPWTGGEDGGSANLDVPESCGGIGKTHGWVTLDVTKMVQGWVATPATNHGMAIDADVFASSGSNRYFASREYPDPRLRPQLVVTYNNRITPPPVTSPPVAPPPVTPPPVAPPPVTPFPIVPFDRHWINLEAEYGV